MAFAITTIEDKNELNLLVNTQSIGVERLNGFESLQTSLAFQFCKLKPSRNV